MGDGRIVSLNGGWWGELNSKPIVIAHRCGCGEAPENTIYACQQAIKNGSSIIQVEVMPAKDGTPIVAQADDLKRLTGKDLKLSELLVEEIPYLQESFSSYLPGLLPEFNTTNYSKEQLQIPTLQKLLEAFVEFDIDKKTALFVEPFQYDVKFIAQVAQVINQVGISDRIIVGHPRDASIQQKIIEMFPDSQILLTMNQCLWMAFLFRIGLLPPEKVPKNRVFNIYYHTEIFAKKVKKVLPFFVWIIFRLISLLGTLLVFKKDFVEYIQKCGCPISAFVVNSEEDWKNLSELGVRGILSDYPSKCRQFIDNNQK